MHAPLKVKDGRKTKEKKKRNSVKDETAETIQEKESPVHDCPELLGLNNEILESDECHLVREPEIENIKYKHDEEKEEKVVKDSNIDVENEVQCPNKENAELTAENCDSSIIKHAKTDKAEVCDNDPVEISRSNSKGCVEESKFSLKYEMKCPVALSDYYYLAEELKSVMEEISTPSAPTVEIDTATLKKSEETSLCLTGISGDVKPDVSNYSLTLILKDNLTPFTEEKLSEFYYNSELIESKDYIHEFIQNENDRTQRTRNKFYRLIVEYIHSKNSHILNEEKIQDLKVEIKNCLSSMWTVWNDVKVTEKEKCSDGNIVAFTQSYTQAQFNSDVFKEFVSLLTEMKQVIFETHSVDLFFCSVLRRKIEYYLYCILTSCPEFTDLEDDGTPHLMFSSLTTPSSFNSHFKQCLLDLKLAISILFEFQRQQTLQMDNSVLQESRQWLSDLVSVLLRFANFQDHIFLLCHIMRCPGGISEWATHFVQLPYSMCPVDPFQNVEINHMLTVMNVLLSPIEQRENFIKKWECEIANDINPWTVIDSDGEIEDEEPHQLCPLKENDLVSLLNQIPFSRLFKAVLRCNGKSITDGVVTSDYLLKLFSFSTSCIKILFSGLKVYSTQRYRQFTKRLSRLIYHIVQYATDALIIFKSQEMEKSRMDRIQVEYDSFFLRSAKIIYSAKKHGAWQFLATFPYSMASSNAITKLYGILQLSDSQDEHVLKVNFSSFEEKFLQLPEEEEFYLLTTFSNMALARNLHEMEFIKNVLLQLFYIGFLSSSTMDHCYKNVKSLLCSMCSKHPSLISELLRIQERKFISDPSNEQQLTIYLWMKLPLESWRPEKNDLEILGVWLLKPVQCVRHELAKLILQSLNYGISDGELFMPFESHRSIAFMVLQSNTQSFVHNDNEAGVIKTVSNLVRMQSPEIAMSDWTWNLLLKLRLHLLDRSDATFCKCYYNLGDYLQKIPNVESNVELHHLVLNKHPIASFVALMTTSVGHSVPLIFERGFDLVEVLFQAGKYEPTVACLEYMTLLFLECSDSLYQCDKFISLLTRLVVADNSYVQLAKNIISNNFPGPVLKCLEIMIQNQINHCRTLNYTNFGNIIRLWLVSLSRISSWTQEPGVLYLMDKLVQNSFFDVNLNKMLTHIFQNTLESNTPAKSSFSSLVSWMNSKYSPPSLLPKGFNGATPWFSYLIIQMEFEIYEKRSSLWIELLKELHASRDKKTNIDNSLKKVCNQQQISVRPSSVLAIYRWCYQIMETDLSHPLVPLLWQKFFSLYLYKIPGMADRRSLGEKFFDGVLNQVTYKRLKLRLQETCAYLKNVIEQSEGNHEQEHFMKCYKLFQAYSLWLDDPRMQEPCLSVHMLPVQYNAELLGLIIHGSETPWVEYLEYNYMERNFRECSLKWSEIRSRLRDDKNSNITRFVKEKSLADRLNDKLNSYEVPLAPPSVNLKRYASPKVTFDTLIHPDKILHLVQPLLKTLQKYGNYFINEMNENIGVGYDMQELIPRMFVTTETQKVLKDYCCGINKTVGGKVLLLSCSGPAVVKLRYQESKLNEQVKQNFDQCQEVFNRNIQQVLSPFPSSVTSAAFFIDTVIEELRREYKMAKKRSDVNNFTECFKKSGVQLFYELVRHWRENVTQTPLLEKAFKNYIDTLGKTFVDNNPEEIDRILNLVLNDRFTGVKLTKYFTPNASPTYEFIDNYAKVLQFTSERTIIALSRFNVGDWLLRNKPKFSEISCLITTIGRGLKSINDESEEQKLIKLLNHHLQMVLMHDFPEHYGEVLNVLLEANENQTIPQSSWYTFINSLAFVSYKYTREEVDLTILEPGQPVHILKAYFSKYATEQNLIPFEVIKGTMKLLASTFNSERLKVGALGLYRKYCPYIEPIFIFFGMLSYSCVVKALELDNGSLSEHITQQLWPLLCDLYTPWLVPYWVENTKPSAKSTQKPSVDKVVTLPWVINDSCQASFCASIFSGTVRFVIDALPGVNHILSYVWYFYFTNFSHICVKDYILNVIHESLLPLPWETFFPALQDVEFMLRIVDQFLPLCHSFLGNIFVKIKWTELVQYYLSSFDTETTTKLHICLLHLLVKLPLEPSLKQNDKITALLTESKDYAWHLLDSSSYELVLNWFIMSCDPRIILMDERLEYYKLDSSIFRLLQASSGYVPTVKLLHPTTLTKRLMFVKTCVKWLITSNRRFKCKDSPLFKSALTRIWNDMETVVTETTPQPQRVQEAELLVAEFLVIFKESELSPLVEVTLYDWLSSQRSQVVVLGLFRSAGSNIENPIVFGKIVESSLENYLNYSENYDWPEITAVLAPFSKSDAQLEKVLIDNNCLLTLYAILLKRFLNRDDQYNSKSVFTDLLHLFSEVKLSPSLEPKLILLITFFLKLAENEIKYGGKEEISYLIKFSDTLNNFVNEKGSGFLSAIGLKTPSCSNRFKLICLVTSCGIGVFIKRNYSQYEEAVDDKILQALDSADVSKVYQDIQQYASYAKSVVKGASTIEQIVDFLKEISLKLFDKLYLE